jgi:hypothetical protein
MAISIQFYGIDDVINAVEKSKCPAWAIFQGRQFMFKCELPTLDESTQLLKEILESLAENSVIYTIKLYECSEGEARKIDEKTKCDAGSFNFKLTELEDLTQRRERYISGRIDRKNSFEERMLALEQKLDAVLKDDEPEDEDEETLETAVIGMIQDPHKLMEFFQTLQQGQAMLMGKNISPSSIGSVLQRGQIKEGTRSGPAEAQPNLSQPTEQDIQRLHAALDTLGRNDPNIIANLEKLAILSQDKPGTYNMAVKMLQGM